MIRPDLASLAARVERPLVTRFAPSPTGYLHLGHVVNAIYTWGIARALGGRIVLRIEDHDRIRSRAGYEAAILEDLDWLGFVADTPAFRQSGAPEAYEQALHTLRGTHHVYACECSRKDVRGERYGGRCRGRRLAMTSNRGVRVILERTVEHIEDALLGPLDQVPAEQCGDVLVRDRDGHWTYQFAVTVDDHRQGITLVVRGADLVSSTGRQVALARMLGRARPPMFLHHPLILKHGGEKLSKSSGDTGVRELRAKGASAPEVIGRAAAAIGLIPAARALPAPEVPDLFG